jgi:DNA mismatch repair protein MutS
MIREYLKETKRYLEEYGDKTILLTQNGAFFEAYGLKDDNNIIYDCKLCDFSRICDLNIVDKNVSIDGAKVVNAGFKTHLIDKYIKKLQDNGFTIVVMEETDEDPINKSKIREVTGIYSPGTFFYEEETEQITNNICCLWIETKKGTLKKHSKNQIYIGIGLIDIYTGNTFINETTEEYIKNPTTFDNLERFISIYKPSETIIVSNLPINEINDIISFINLKSKSLHIVSLLDTNNGKNIKRAINCEKQIYQTTILGEFYKINDINSFMGIFYDNVYATQAFCYLLDFIKEHNKCLINKIAEPILENTCDKLILANHSLKQLNIIDDDNYKGKYSSVVKMLNECITPMGKRKFAYNFLNPVTNIIHLQNEYNITETLLENTYISEYNTVKSMLSQIKDVDKILRQIIIKKISPKTLYQLFSSMNFAKNLHCFIEKNKKLNEYLKAKIPRFVSLLKDIDDVNNYLDSVLYLDECQTIDNISKIEKSFIKNGVDEELDDKIKTLMETQDRLEACQSYFSSLISEYENKSKSTKSKSTKSTKSKSKVNIQHNSKNIIEDDNNCNNIVDEDDDDDTKLYVKLHETEKNNISLIATERRCKLLEEAIKTNKNANKKVLLTYLSSYSKTQIQFEVSLELEYTRQSSSNKTINSLQLSSIYKTITSIKLNIINVISKVYKNIIEKLQDYHDNIENVSNFITYVDLAYSKALIALKYNYCKPEISTNIEHSKSFIRASNLRHCLIEKIQQTELYVANDINIGNKKDNKQDNKQDLEGILLYGTNAVGKTSFIRALGISIIMAQAGLYVPASKYIYKPYKYIFTRILGNDNIFKGLSTFAVEMSELRTILRLADENSLVLGDELCSGTESISAVSIFVAGIQKLATIGCSFIFATHLHEIINYDEIVSLHNVGMKHMSVIYDKENDCLVYDRKLRDGPGNSMYGLEVCKSLNLPQDFLENAQNIRIKYHPETGSILDHKSSHFNAKHIKGGLCEKCNINLAIDVHHLIFQNEADENGIIKKKDLTFGKNTKANLMNLCQKCHDEIHKTNKKLKKIKTTKGITILPLEN